VLLSELSSRSNDLGGDASRIDFGVKAEAGLRQNFAEEFGKKVIEW
jgi:hypothetical protein